MNDCFHKNRTCLNQYDIIRKYRCDDCIEVMMCNCDELYGTRFLPHQIKAGRDYKSGYEFEVSIGFQPRICSECRGLPADNFPKAEIYGSTSKIKRYYWRELHFQRFRKTLELYGEEQDYFDLSTEQNKTISRAALDAVKELHKTSPKYKFLDLSQAEIIKKFDVTVINFEAEHTRVDGEKGVKIKHKGENYSAEEFVSLHYVEQGFKVLELESVPFHVLFGTFMWMLIQDPNDAEVQMVGFGNRDAVYDPSIPATQIFTQLPMDFGKSGYGERRREAINKHFELDHLEDKDHLLWLYDYWLSYRHDLRQYLWANRKSDIETARQVLKVLPAKIILKIMRYLIDSYWSRYTGWPDLLVYNDNSFKFVEVKSSKDKLSGDQKIWIEDNSTLLHLPFEIAKIHKPNLQKK